MEGNIFSIVAGGERCAYKQFYFYDNMDVFFLTTNRKWLPIGRGHF